ncbi:carboxypeptidase-like regulatory domain-containing protein [Methanotrichaceae archaeon M04Ac]|uniref:Carboxypeptidase-like regulatory domain-containing protein n=1 Tax=Candidatus Methanocrinis alkalitolerans TaxID=3033395 RepID=A0ABT5XD18_9EURY|nr:carboxypeptidase-like regulatory domain-containing protein [Candidatus Methanocrinis alkalitolerans]MDF0592543.1 carboxypeptidase-like regulatory domain-containing protein [Candidatus Methanocrinis alkalitolerans]
MRLKLILAANLIAILLFAGLNCNALPFLETPTVSDEELGRIQGTLQSSAATVSGRVYEGDFRDESKPFPNVRVELCCSNDQKNRGRVVESATTDAKGWYELTLPSGCEFYDIVVTVPEGYIAAGADSAGGDVIDENWIQYGYPLDRSVLTGNKFWIKKSVPELPLIPLRPLVPVTPQEPETVSCPKGCECMTQEMAKEKFDKYERCLPEICGYDDLRRPMYCFRPVEDVSPEIECPRGCECMTEEMAKEEFGKYERCSPEICGYDDLRRPMYCFRPTEFPPETECPEGCECLLEEVAAEKFRGYEWCSDEVCGFSEGKVPKYCFRPVEDLPEECPQGCECLIEEVAAEKFGRYDWCSDEVCGFGEGKVPKYCFRPVEDLPEECPQGCECLIEEVAAEKFGRYEWCSDEICGLSDAGVPKYCFRPAEPAPEVPPESCELYFSTEEDFIAQGPIPPDGNPIISDGDLLGPGCVLFARNRELLAAFNVNVDLGLDAVDVIDAKGRLVGFSTELDDPSGRFVGGDLLATNGLVIPNSALLAGFDVARIDLGLDAVHFVGDPEDIVIFLDRSSQMSRDEWLEDPGILPEMLREYGVDIWFSTEGTPSWTGNLAFIDGDLLSARDGIIVAPNSILLPPSVPAGIPNRGVDFGLDAATADRNGNREQIRFSTEILYEGKPAFSDGDVILIDDTVTCTNWDLIRCFEPKTRELGLDALSMAPRGELGPQTCHPDLPAPELVVAGKEDRVIGGSEYTRYELLVTNWNLYPAELFEAAPDLQPCGTNTEASRTWVDIRDQDGGRIYGFCALSSPEELRDLWFAVERGGVHPESVYVTLADRRCDAVYVSNVVPIPPSG